MTTVDQLLEEYREAATDAGRLAAAADGLDEQRRIVFSEQVLAAGDMAVAKAEHAARASAPYKQVCRDIEAARREAAEARASADYLEKRFEAWRSKMASARAAQQHGERR